MPIKMKRGDTLEPLLWQLTDGVEADGVTVIPNDLSTATSVKVCVVPEGAAPGDDPQVPWSDVEIQDAANGNIRYLWQTGDADVAGRFDIYVRVVKPTGRKTYPTSGTFKLVIEDAPSD